MIQVKFNDKAKQVLADTLDLGGSVVVTELPTVGEPHTIYELQETSKASYGWVFNNIPSVNSVYDFFLVFDTYEQMTTTINAIQIDENTQDEDYYAYIRNTNQLYLFVISPVVEGEDHYWVFKEQQKKEDESGTNYAFQLETLSDYKTFYILKEFVGNERPIADGGWEYTYLTLDNKEVYIGNEGCGFIISDIVHPNKVVTCEFITCEAHITSNTLPNLVELETSYYNLLRATYGHVVCYNTSNNKYYEINTRTENYFWYGNQEDREDCYFAQVVEYEVDKPPHYEGELEWDEMSFASHPEFNEIPYNEIINVKLKDPLWMFKPKKDGEVTSTYWIYSNNTWTNTEDIGKPVEQEVIYGELLEGPTFSTDHKFISSYTNEQICNYIEEGKPVILRYHEKYMSDNEFMYVYINGYVPTEMDVEYVNQPLHYDNFTCREYTTTDRIMYNYGSDYFYYELGE